MTRWLYGVGRFCAERAKLVLALWITAAVVVIGVNHVIPSSSLGTFTLQGTDSATAQQLLSQAFPGTSTQANPVVLSSDTLDFGSGEGATIVSNVESAIAKMPEISTVTGPQQQPNLLSEDGHSAIVQVVVNEQYAGQNALAASVLDTAKQAAGPQVQVSIGGMMGNILSSPNTKLSEGLGLLAALIVLCFTMRRLSATLLPLVNAMVAVGIGLAIVQLLGRVVFIPDVAPTLGTMLGLGVGIDYALFLVTRHRKLLRAGYGVADSVGRTAGTAGAGMVFAGCTLIAAVCGLAMTNISFLAWLGYAAAIVVIVAVLASLTLVPALLGLLGHRILPKKQSGHDDPDHDALDQSWWARLATSVTNRPWIFAITSSVILLLMALPTLTLQLGNAGSNDLPPETVARQAYDAMAEGFGPGSTAPLAIVTQLYTPATAPANFSGSGDPRTADPRLVALQHDLQSTPGVASVSNIVVSTDGGVSVITVTPDWNASDPQTAELVAQIRSDVIPGADAGNGMHTYVGGVTALTTDLYAQIAARTPAFIIGVVILSFILLMFAYRSLLIPFKAACMNLLSIAAAYGVVTMVFQWGWGMHLIGVDELVPIEAYIPMMMFAVLFGLSMDYEVFLLTAFREHWERSGNMVVAIRRGLADTGRLVTAAALIMVVVFASFILSDNVTVKMFGVGLATAVAVDATIVRCLLVPAIMVLAAKGTWWLPGWLDRLLPRLHVEGDPAALDAASARSAEQSRRPIILQRPAIVIGTMLGVGVAWILVARLPIVPANAHTAIAMSAVLGGITTLLPVGFAGDKGSRPMRALGYIIGVVIGLLVISLLQLVVPPASADNGAITSWAIVLVALVAVMFISRPLTLPMLLGAIATALSEGLLFNHGTDSSTLVLVALLPALVVIMVASVVVGLVGDRGIDSGDQQDPTTEPEPQQSETPKQLVPLLHLDEPEDPKP